MQAAIETPDAVGLAQSGMKKTFAEIFCSHHALPPARFAPVLLQETYYPHAAAFATLVRLLSPVGFSLDNELVRGVGLISRRDQLAGVLTDFRIDLRNRGFLRSRLRLRVSTRRMQRVVYDLMPAVSGEIPPAGASASPTPGGGQRIG